MMMSTRAPTTPCTCERCSAPMRALDEATASSKASRRALARALLRSAVARCVCASSPAASAFSRRSCACAASTRRSPSIVSAAASSPCNASMFEAMLASRCTKASIRACNFCNSPADCSTVLRNVRSSPRTSAAALLASLPCTV